MKKDLNINKYLLMFWDIPSQSMKPFPPKNPKYLTEQEFIDGDWEEKGFELNKN